MIIGITGTLGAGKTTVASYLATQGFIYRSVRSFIIEELQRRRETVTRDSLVNVGNEIRAKHGPDYIIRTLIEEAAAQNHDVVIESIRAAAEAELLIAKGGYLISIDADQTVRYERIIESAGQVVPVSLTEFQSQEAREMFSTDTNKQSISEVMARAQFSIINSGDESKLHNSIDTIVQTIRLRETGKQ